MKAKLRKTALEGSALVEFALVAPLLFLLLFAIFDFARLGFTLITLDRAASAAARCAAIHDTATCSNVANFALEQSWGFNNPTLKYTESSEICGGKQVTGKIDFEFIIPWWPIISPLSNPLHLEAASCFPDRA